VWWVDWYPLPLHWLLYELSASLFPISRYFTHQRVHFNHLCYFNGLTRYEIIITHQLHVLEWTYFPLTVFITWWMQFRNTSNYHVSTFVIGQRTLTDLNNYNDFTSTSALPFVVFRTPHTLTRPIAFIHW